jgi:hypothetical protein
MVNPDTIDRRRKPKKKANDKISVVSRDIELATSLVSDGYKLKYLKSGNNVFQDIFGYKKFFNKIVNRSYYDSAVIGYSLRYIRGPVAAAIRSKTFHTVLREMILLDYAIIKEENKLKNKKMKKKNKEKLKEKIKKKEKLYNRSKKAIKKALHISKEENKSNFNNLKAFNKMAKKNKEELAYYRYAMEEYPDIYTDDDVLDEDDLRDAIMNLAGGRPTKLADDIPRNRNKFDFDLDEDDEDDLRFDDDDEDDSYDNFNGSSGDFNKALLNVLNQLPDKIAANLAAKAYIDEDDDDDVIYDKDILRRRASNYDKPYRGNDPELYNKVVNAFNGISSDEDVINLDKDGKQIKGKNLDIEPDDDEEEDDESINETYDRMFTALEKKMDILAKTIVDLGKSQDEHAEILNSIVDALNDLDEEDEEDDSSVINIVPEEVVEEEVKLVPPPTERNNSNKNKNTNNNKKKESTSNADLFNNKSSN